MKKRTTEELEKRLSDIGTDLDSEGADLEALENEVRDIKDELERRRKEEQRKIELRSAIAAGAGSVKRTFGEEKRDMDIGTKEYRNAWLMNLQGNLSPEQRTDYGFTTGGTYATNAIPTLVADRFFEKMKKLAPMLSEITLLQVAGNISFVAEGTRNAATKHTENAAITPELDTTVEVKLGGFEFVKVVGISKAAQVMSIDAFEGWLVEMLAGDIARAIENYILNDSTNGLAYNINTASTNTLVVTTGDYTYANIVAVEGMLPAAYDAEAKWLTTKKVLWSKIAAITDSSGRSVFIADPSRDRVGSIFGRDVVVSDYATGKSGQDAIYLGKLTDIVGNLSQGISVEPSDEAGFLQNQRLYRGSAVFDSKLAKTDAFVQLVTTV